MVILGTAFPFISQLRTSIFAKLKLFCCASQNRRVQSSAASSRNPEICGGALLKQFAVSSSMRSPLSLVGDAQRPKTPPLWWVWKPSSQGYCHKERELRRDNQDENPATIRMRMRRCWG